MGDPVFVVFHKKKIPFVVALDSLKGFTKPLKGAGTYIVTDQEETTGEVDEPLADVLKALVTLDVEIIEFAND